MRKLIALSLLLSLSLCLSAQELATPSATGAQPSNWQTLDELLTSIESEATLSKAELQALSTQLSLASSQLRASQIDRLELSRLSAWLGQSYQLSETARKQAERCSNVKNYVIGALGAIAAVFGVMAFVVR